jgi:hypothetical protein
MSSAYCRRRDAWDIVVDMVDGIVVESVVGGCPVVIQSSANVHDGNVHSCASVDMTACATLRVALLDHRRMYLA